MEHLVQFASVLASRPEWAIIASPIVSTTASETSSRLDTVAGERSSATVP